jgi:hypothetical protein
MGGLQSPVLHVSTPPQLPVVHESGGMTGSGLVGVLSHPRPTTQINAAAKIAEKTTKLTFFIKTLLVDTVRDRAGIDKS